MTYTEFMMWLDGFSYSFVDGAPDKAQYQLILKKLQSINNYYVKPTYRSSDPMFRTGDYNTAFKDHFTLT